MEIPHPKRESFLEIAMGFLDLIITHLWLYNHIHPIPTFDPPGEYSGIQRCRYNYRIW